MTPGVNRSVDRGNLSGLALLDTAFVVRASVCAKEVTKFFG